MKNLSEPSKDMASKILNEVGFEERFIAYRLRERTGPIPITLYSFEEAVGLLNDPFPGVDFTRLEDWIREVMGDGELADKIRDVIARDISARDKTLCIRDLMVERLIQCRRIT